VVAPFLPDAEKLEAVRDALPALAAGIYLNTGSAGPLPAETAAAMAEMTEYELRLGRSHADYFEAFLERLAEARGAVAAVIGADIGSIAIGHSTSHAMNLAVWSVELRPGDRIVTTSSEHAGGLGPVVVAGRRFGAEVVAVDIGGGNDEQTLAAFDAAIAPGTRLVALSHVLWTTGARLPIAEIAELAHARGALVAVDGAQAVGAIPVSVVDLGVDFYAVAGQKWLLGPEGTGALWVAPEVLEGALPSFASWFTFERITSPTDAVLWSDARRFDDTNYYKPGVVGLARSCGWLSMYIGLPWVHERGQAMAVRAADRLATIPGVDLLTPRERMATLVTFRIAGWGAEAALDELAARTFVVARTIPVVDAIRLSVGFFTTEAEIERVAATVELIAAHTPSSLPPRQRLTILGLGDG
jgi:L-cysteine/cystine lyase